jgi:hypothetical protein
MLENLTHASQPAINASLLAKSQAKIPAAILVRGTAAVVHSGHRISFDRRTEPPMNGHADHQRETLNANTAAVALRSIVRAL